MLLYVFLRNVWAVTTLRVHPAETRLTVYRRPYIYARKVVAQNCRCRKLVIAGPAGARIHVIFNTGSDGSSVNVGYGSDVLPPVTIWR